MIINLPFSALRAFEAVARHGGFSSAASELGVSQSAISQQVKSLEEWLGQELIIRGARQSVLTREGKQLAQAIIEGLGHISDVCVQLRDRKRANKTIVISCLPGFAFNWLFPRLLRFDLAYPEISISIVTDIGNRPFSGVEADIGIRYGLGNHPGLHREELLEESLFPVCAPNLLSRANKLESVSDLQNQTLLVDETLVFGTSAPTWDYWARACNVSLPSSILTRKFGQANLVVQAAIEGMGVALGREPLVIDALNDGRLVRPLEQATQSPLSYWLVCRNELANKPNIKKFFNWIHTEANSQQTLPGPLVYG
jgi:LysR family glycine cleavage system transcriptional activator